MHAEEQKSHGKQWLFGIGIGKYVELPNLANAVKDVKDIIQVLTEDYGVSPSNTITLFNEEANRENLIHRLDQLAGKVGKDDSLLIYFAGHGYLNKTTDIGYWIPHDAKKGRTSLYIGNSTIRDYIKAINAKHTLLITDSCFSGSFFVRGASRSSVALQELETIPSRWAICSGRSDEEVSDGIPGENSPFAQSILDVLKENTNKLLNVAKVADRVVEQTRSNYEQLPEGNPIQGVGHKGGQYIFHRKAREEKFWEECQRKNTVRYYSQYLRQFPNGKHRSHALLRIKELEDKAAWKLAENSNTIFGFYNYIGRDPDGKYIKNAEERISILENIEASLSDPEPPSTEENNLANIEHATEQGQITTLEIEEDKDARKESEESSLEPALENNLANIETSTEQREMTSQEFLDLMVAKNGPEEQLGEPNQKEENSRLFVEFKRSSLFSLKISIIFYVIVGFMLVLYVSDVVYSDMVWAIVMLGYALYQIEGITFSIKSHSVGFKGGTHAGYLLPIFTFFAWLVGTFFIEDYSKGFLPFAFLGPIVVSILGRRYIVIAAQKKWVSAEDL